MSIGVKTSLTSGILASIATSLCCIAPLVLLMLGISGAWISNLVALEPYSPIFIVVALTALFFAYRGIFVKKSCSSSDDKLCTKPSVSKLYKIIFFVVAIMVVLSIVAPYVILYYNS